MAVNSSRAEIALADEHLEEEVREGEGRRGFVRERKQSVCVLVAYCDICVCVCVCVCVCASL